MIIIQKPSPSQGSRDGNPIKYICIHIMSGSLVGTDSEFLNAYNQKSSNYGVGLLGEVHQYVDDDKMAWANGGVIEPTAQIVKDNLTVNQNKISLSIECEGKNLADAPETQLLVLIELIKSLSAKYNIPLDRTHIIGHRELNTVNRPNCPAPSNAVLDNIVQRCLGVQSNRIKQLVLDIEGKFSELKTLI